MEYIVSTCGTSILTNLERRYEHRGDFSVVKLSNKTEKELTSDEKGYLDNLLAQSREASQSWTIEEAKKDSAELNGLLTYYGNITANGEKNLHYFVHSDTYVGQECANIIEKWCQGKEFKTSLHFAPGLNTADYWSFREAMTDLTKWCNDFFNPENRNEHSTVVFNLTGGFKSVNGFMQTLGMIYADGTFYFFEGSSELMRIPRLPIDIETSARAKIEAHFDVYRKLSLSIAVTDADISVIPESMVLTDGENGYVLSVWGDIFWNKFKTEFYGQKLYPSPLPERIEISKKFLDSVKNCGGNRLCMLNQQIDKLAGYLLSGRSDNLRSLRYHALEGKPMPGSTHEFYAWSDQNAGRVYCHEKDNVIILDQLDGHL